MSMAKTATHSRKVQSDGRVSAATAKEVFKSPFQEYVQRIPHEVATSLHKDYLAGDLAEGGFLIGEQAPHFASQHYQDIVNILSREARVGRGVILSASDYSEERDGRLFERHETFM